MSDVAAQFSAYLSLQRALAPSYIEDGTLPPFASPPATVAELTALADAIGPLGASLSALLGVASGVRAFNLFSLDLRSAADIAAACAADTAWLEKEITEIADDIDDDDDLQTMLRSLTTAVILGESSQRRDLVLLQRSGDDWSVSQLVNSRWWEVPENTYPTISEWLAALHGGAAADAETKGITHST